MKKDRLARRLGMSLAGVLICASCVALCRVAAFGVDPFQSMMSGLNYAIPISFGLLYTLVNVALVLFVFCFGRHYIGLATLINLFLYGYITDFVMSLLVKLWPVPSLAVRVGCLAVGIVAMCLGSALYMTADLGVSSYDAVSLIMTHRWKLGQFRFLRVLTDFVCVALGTVLFLVSGGTWKELLGLVGIGTVITAFFMGPLIDFFNRKLALPLLNRGGKPADAKKEEKGTP